MFFKTFRPAETALSPPQKHGVRPLFSALHGQRPFLRPRISLKPPAPSGRSLLPTIRSAAVPRETTQKPGKRLRPGPYAPPRRLIRQNALPSARAQRFRRSVAARGARPLPCAQKKTARSPGKARRHLLRRKTIRAMPSARSRSPRRSAWRRGCVRTARPASSRGVPRPNGSHRASSPRQNACP